MFGVLVNAGIEGGTYFKVFKDLTSAQDYANIAVNSLGYKATVFDYDQSDETFLEFYEA